VSTASRRQEQVDAVDAVASKVRAIVRRDPFPPRRVDRVRLTLSMYRGKLLKLALLDGAAAALFVITFYQRGSAASIWGLRIFWLFAFLLFLIGPWLAGRPVARWARDALVATADVEEAHHGLSRFNRPEVRGRRIVHHPELGDFRDEFTTVGPWAPSVVAGSKLEVLVAPDERRSWLTLGLAS
jgi:hypothetical protein